MRISRCLLCTLAMVLLAATAASAQPERPNIVWLCGEDLGPHLGAYGDPYAQTPNIDALAGEGLTYDIAWSNAPVCAPARTTLAMGMYAPSLGAQHMRSFVDVPDDFKMYQQLLREGGYYTANHGKHDFNVPRTGQLWSGDARPAEAEEPFFIKLRFGRTHESGVGHASAQVEGEVEEYNLPPFHPDIPEAHRNWATYYHRIAQFDDWVGDRINELKDAGLWDDTIVILWGDHGPGLPRGKRFTRDFGLNTPLIVHIPERFRDNLAPAEFEPGAHTDRPVSFVDYGPTMLSLAGIEPPDYMQGRAFMGVHEAPAREYVFGFRGRMDERIDMMRTVRDKRYQLIRNYMPHRRYGQYVQYLHRNPTMDKWQRLHEAGEIDPPASFYWQPKPPIELYDLEQDPHEVRNLAYDPEYQDVRKRLMDALHEHQETIRDLGFLPEAQIHSRPDDGESPYAFAHDTSRYPLREIREMAERAAGRGMEALPALVEGLEASDPAVRYWAVTGLLVRGQDAVWPQRQRLRQVMEADPDPTMRVVAAEALARHSNTADREAALQALLELGNSHKTNAYSAVAALNVIDKLGEAARPIHEGLKALPKRPENGPRRASGYTERLLEKILSDLSE